MRKGGKMRKKTKWRMKQNKQRRKSENEKKREETSGRMRRDNGGKEYLGPIAENKIVKSIAIVILNMLSQVTFKFV